MLKEDVSKLAFLVEKYDPKEVINSLALVIRYQADEKSDMGLKEQAIATLDLVDLLRAVCDLME